MGQDIADLHIQLALDSRSLQADMDRASAQAAAGAGRIAAEVARAGKEKNPLAGLEKMFEDFSRRQVNRFGGGLEAGIGVFASAAQHARESTQATVKESFSDLTGLAGGVVGGFAPVAGAVLGQVGGLITSVVGVIEDALSGTRNKAFAIFDQIVAGTKTVAQGLRSARLMGLEQTTRQMAQLGGPEGGFGRYLPHLFSAANIEAEANAVRDRLQLELATPARRHIIRSVATERAHVQGEDTIRAMTEAGARGGLQAQDAQRLQMAQQLAAQAGVSLADAQQRLADILPRVRIAQQAAAFGEAQTAARTLTLQLTDQSQTAHLTADETQRYQIAMDYARASGITFAAAQQQLAGALANVQQAAAGGAIAQLAQQTNLARQAGSVLIANWREFGQTVEGLRGPLDEVLTTQESIGRQDAIAAVARQGGDVNRQIADAATEAAQQQAELRGRVAAAQADIRGAIGAGGIGLEGALGRLGAAEAELAAAVRLGRERRDQLGINRAALAANEEQLRQQDLMLRNMELQRAAMAQGRQLMVQMRSPLEQSDQRMADLSGLFQRGAINWTTLSRAIGQSVDQLEQASGGPNVRMAEALGEGTAAAQSAINRYSQQRENPIERLIRVQEQARVLQAEQTAVQQQLTRAVIAGRVLAAVRL